MTAFEGTNWSVSIGTLKQLHMLQQAYREVNGAYAGTLDELKQVGWEGGEHRQMYPHIVHHRSRLCLAMLPRVRALPAWSMGTDGTIHRGAYCGRVW